MMNLMSDSSTGRRGYEITPGVYRIIGEVVGEADIAANSF